MSRISRLETKGARPLIEAEPVRAVACEFVVSCQTVLFA